MPLRRPKRRAQATGKQQLLSAEELDDFKMTSDSEMSASKEQSALQTYKVRTRKAPIVVDSDSDSPILGGAKAKTDALDEDYSKESSDASEDNEELDDALNPTPNRRRSTRINSARRQAAAASSTTRRLDSSEESSDESEDSSESVPKRRSLRQLGRLQPDYKDPSNSENEGDDDKAEDSEDASEYEAVASEPSDANPDTDDDDNDSDSDSEFQPPARAKRKKRKAAPRRISKSTLKREREGMRDIRSKKRRTVRALSDVEDSDDGAEDAAVADEGMHSDESVDDGGVLVKDVEMRDLSLNAESAVSELPTFTQWLASLKIGENAQFATRPGRFLKCTVQCVCRNVRATQVSALDAMGVLPDIAIHSTEEITLSCTQRNADEWQRFALDKKRAVAGGLTEEEEETDWWRRVKIGDVIECHKTKAGSAATATTAVSGSGVEKIDIETLAEVCTAENGDGTTDASSKPVAIASDSQKTANGSSVEIVDSTTVTVITEDSAKSAVEGTGNSEDDVVRYRVIDSWFAVDVTYESRGDVLSESFDEKTMDSKLLLRDRLKPMDNSMQFAPSREPTPAIVAKPSKKATAKGKGKGDAKGKKRKKKKNAFASDSDSEEESEASDGYGEDDDVDMAESKGVSMSAVPSSVSPLDGDYQPKIEQIMYTLMLPTTTRSLASTFNHLKQPKTDASKMAELQKNTENTTETDTGTVVGAAKKKKTPTMDTGGDMDVDCIDADDGDCVVDKENNSDASNQLATARRTEVDLTLTSSSPSPQLAAVSRKKRATGFGMSSLSSLPLLHNALTETSATQSSSDLLGTSALMSSSPSKRSRPLLVRKYLCKMVNRSYHECEWLSEREIIGIDGESKMKNFDQKFRTDGNLTPEQQRVTRRLEHALETQHFDRVQFFSAAYLQIDRIVDICYPNECYKVIKTTSGNMLSELPSDMDESEVDDEYFKMKKMQGKTAWQSRVNDSAEKLYLVKWHSLQYDKSTWERESFLQNVDFDSLYGSKKQIQLFKKRHSIPDRMKCSASSGKLHKMFYRKSAKFQSGIVHIEEGLKFKNDNELRYYQTAGVKWLLHNWAHENPCILADEMGLGKTVQTVAFINECMKQGNFRGPFLIVAPLSTLAHWSREFQGWSELNAVVYHGNADSRAKIRDVEFKWQFAGKRSHVKTQTQLNALNACNWRFDVLITTPQTVNSDKRWLKWSEVKWQCVIVDEAHCLKSRGALIYRTLRQFQSPNWDRRQNGTRSVQTHTVLLTGTPIQNNMKELFALLHFMNPSKFVDEETFTKRFEDLENAEARTTLKDLIATVLLQRYKSLVEKNLQSRDERIIWVELTKFQKKWYKALYERSYDTLRKIGGVKSSLMNVSMQLRKCCNHPFLIRDVEASISPLGTCEEVVYENLTKASGKLVLLDKLLPKLQADGHRLLIFSQMSRLLNILEDYLLYRGVEYERLDGSVTGIARQEAIDRFTRDKGILVFLLTTRAGGVGINLMAADTVVIFDSDWNPMNDVQAIARAHRIGQTKKVSVYRLVTRNTYEEQMFRRADQKMALNKVVMGDMKDMSKQNIKDMLAKGAIAMFLKDRESDLAIEKFAAASIDEILQTRTEEVKTEENEEGRAVGMSLAGGNAAKEEGAMFSEAVFVAAAEDAEVDINAEDFWDTIGLEDPKKRVNPEDEVEMYRRGRGKYRMRKRAGKGRRGDRGSDDSGSEYDFGESEDNQSAEESEDWDSGDPLLGVLLTRLWGLNHDIFTQMSLADKITLGLHKEEEDDEESPASAQTSKKSGKTSEEKKAVENAGDVNMADATGDSKSTAAAGVSPEKPPLEECLDMETSEKLTVACVQTVAAIFQLTKPEIRITFTKNKDCLLLDPLFRFQAVTLLERQLRESEKWKAQIEAGHKAREDVCSRGCKCGCGRLVAGGLTRAGHPYDTCCRQCTEEKSKFHSVHCDRSEAVQVIVRMFELLMERVDIVGSDEAMSSKAVTSQLHRLSTDTLMLCVLTDDISNEGLKRMLKNKEYGDIKAIVSQLERMFVVRGMLLHLVGYKYESVTAGGCRMPISQCLASNEGTEAYIVDSLGKLPTFAKLKPTKTMPEWWNATWDKALLCGTLIYGWGKVPEAYAKMYGFTTEYQSLAKVKAAALASSSPSMKELSKSVGSVSLDSENVTSVAAAIGAAKDQPLTAAASSVKPAVDGTYIVTSTTGGSVAVAKPTTSEVIDLTDAAAIVTRKRNWISQKKQTSRLLSIVSVFRTAVRKLVRNQQTHLLNGMEKAWKKEVDFVESQRRAAVAAASGMLAPIRTSVAFASGSRRPSLVSEENNAIATAAVSAMTEFGGSTEVVVIADDSSEMKKKKKKRKHKKKHRKRKKHGHGDDEGGDGAVVTADGKHKKKKKRKRKHKHSSKHKVSSVSPSAKGKGKAKAMGSAKKQTMLNFQPVSKLKEDGGVCEPQLVGEVFKIKNLDFGTRIVFSRVSGLPIFPFQVTRNSWVMSLGEIDHRNEAFHNANYLLPVGYKIRVAVAHPLDGAVKRHFVCEIKRSSEMRPLYVAHCEEQPSLKVASATVSGVWTAVYNLEREPMAADSSVKCVSTELTSPRGSGASTPSPRKRQVSGFSRMGFKTADVLKLVECLPNAYKCVNYQFKFRDDLKKKQKKYIKKKLEKEEKERAKAERVEAAKAKTSASASMPIVADTPQPVVITLESSSPPPMSSKPTDSRKRCREESNSTDVCVDTGDCELVSKKARIAS